MRSHKIFLGTYNTEQILALSGGKGENSEVKAWGAEGPGMGLSGWEKEVCHRYFVF